MVGIRIVDMTKRFGDVVAVDQLNLEIKDKEFLVLLGPSGCGKTTALRSIAGLETPEAGEIYIGDTLVNELPPKDRDVAMVFQSYALYPHMRVYDNMAFPLKMRKYAKTDIDRRVKDAAELLRITHLLDRRPRQLSGGEAQRVALGRSIVREPKVFLMDEPLSNLDAKLRLYMRAELKRLQRDLKVTTIYVTHDQAEAMTMGDRVTVMNQGLLQQIGSPDEIYNRPTNTFVAGFMGSPPMNFVDTSFVEMDGGYGLDGGTFRLKLPKALGKLVKEGKSDSEVVLGFRPESVSIHDKAVANSIEMELYIYEPLGSEVVADLKLGESLIKAIAPPTFKMALGKKLWIALGMDRIHVFDKKTEKAIV